MRTPTSAVALRQARLHLLEHGDCPPGGLDERVARSWQRSLAAGLLPADQRAVTVFQQMQTRLAQGHGGGGCTHFVSWAN